MILLDHVCPKCGHITEGFDRHELCRCERCDPKNTSNVFGGHVGNKEYAQPIVSQSLAMNPDQIADHNRLFPDVAVTPDGCPVFTSYAQHDAYLKKTGFVKNPGKRNPRSKSRNGVTVIRASDIKQEMENNG